MIDQKEICVLSTLLLHTSGLEVSENNIKKIATHLGVELDSYLVELFSKVSASTLDKIISNPVAGAAVAVSSEAAASTGAAPVAEKKEESEEESDDFDLF
ncbi:large subunit ribosomal protein LP1 [Nematocida homosporus]|uniref:large subunit ribosomal protein LP1 n=1 Tax=Nematocida homosporus TaxID=1912981 RepID=UPI00221EEC8A|nr:large subunit ribosomal protein LP1 [Nematocida homosporus]KAI5184532.1 large subunit ribosomal protein LP1 [Nematocida homosporus]